MRLRSIKSRLYLLFVAIIVLLGIGVLNYSLNRVGNTAKSNYQEIARIDKSFSAILLTEVEMLQDYSRKNSLNLDYERLRQTCLNCHVQPRDQVLNERQAQFKDLLKIKRELSLLRSNVHKTLIDIIQSVKYIHTHHIAYLKNTLRRGVLSQDYDTGDRFKRSQMQSASELDIIETAVAVYTSLYDIFESFYDLKYANDKKEVSQRFSKRMDLFYQLVNRFEDYSLDAQDGLLIEELLLTGRRFESSFENLLVLDSQQQAALKKLAQNSGIVKQIVESIRSHIQLTNTKITRTVNTVNLFALVFAISIAAWIIFDGGRIIRQIRRTVAETKKIHHDLSYRIGMDANLFAEFRFVFVALNSMAHKISDNMLMLQKARDELEVRVHERTMDLKISNEKLQAEIFDRERMAQELRKAHNELENRVAERTAELTTANRQLQVEMIGRKKAQKNAEDASRAKSDFLANMSHELRTPLNHIIGFTELVVDKSFGELNDTQTEYLNDVLQSGTHLLSLINDILDLSKVEAGKLELKASEISLPALIENSMIMIKEKALKHGIALSTDMDGIPVTIAADERKLKQIMYNLLSNAVKFTPNGGSIAIAARACKLKTNNNSGTKNSSCGGVKITVSDTGIGLKPDEIELIFNAFEQVENSASRTYQGTGLGLSLTKSLVDLHGGRIWAESAGEGQGSSFIFTIPV